MLPTSAVGPPGTHGVVTGMHGIGVRTPSAAEVAAATVGLDSDMHTPKGGMFAIGLKSMMLAKGLPDMTHEAGGTTIVLGAAPKVHCRVAPIVTPIAISTSPEPTKEAREGALRPLLALF